MAGHVIAVASNHEFELGGGKGWKVVRAIIGKSSGVLDLKLTGS
jgi:hypothetical protein